VTRGGATSGGIDRLTPWPRQIGAVLPKHGWLKGIGITLFISVFFVAYFHFLKNPAYPTTLMPIIGFDRLVAFQPRALPIYLSIWVYVSLPPALLGSRSELYGYALAMAATCVCGLIVFYFWPTTIPVSAIDWRGSPEVVFLKRIDASGNACPSLHVATTLFSALWLNHLLPRFAAPRWLLVLAWLWCAAIIYSTLATRQHVALDVLAGLVLGLVAAGLSLRRRRSRAALPRVDRRRIDADRQAPYTQKL